MIASADVRKAADAGKDAVEKVGTLERSVEGGHCAGAVASDGAIVGIL